MHLVTDLENDLVLSILVDKKASGGIETKDLLPLLTRMRKVLEPVSEKDHSQDGQPGAEETAATGI